MGSAALVKNYSNQLAGQIGESLVVAELGRRGFIATAFAGNVPDIDILAYKSGLTVALQVKAWRSGSVSFDAKQYLKIELNGKVQTVAGMVNEHNKDLLFVFVKIGSKAAEDRFFVLQRSHLAEIIKENYSWFLSKHSGIRPRNYKTTHCSVNEEDLQSYADKWELLEEAIKQQ